MSVFQHAMSIATPYPPPPRFAIVTPVSRLYAMLSVAGWLWLVVLAGYVLYNGRRTPPRGFDVLPPGESDGKEPQS